MTWRKIRALDPAADEASSTYEIPSDIIQFVKDCRILDGSPFSFQDRNYLLELYRDKSKHIYIVKGRQVEITEYAVNFLLYHLLKNPGTVGLYVSDRDQHVKVFANDRLRKDAIAVSEILRNMVTRAGGTEFVEFKNGSKLYLASGYDDFEEARSLAVDFVVVDEIQSQNPRALPVVTEALSKSKYGILVVIGTGSEYGDDWWQLWHTGNQKEWDMQTRKWVANNPDSNGISSYRISQEMVPDIPKEGIEIKRKGNPRYFQTECLGQWFKGTKRPLNSENIRRLFDRTFAITTTENVNRKWPIFMGVDLGGGTRAYTIVWIWQLIKKSAPRFQVLNVIKITEPSTEKQADMIAELIDKYNVEMVVSDAGGGIRQVEKLSQRFKNRFFRCNYRYDTNKPFEIIWNETRINVDRTWIIETMIDLIKREEEIDLQRSIPRIRIPFLEPDKIEWIIEQFTCIEAENAESGGRNYVRYTHGEETNDDALHACCYAYLAYMIGGDKPDWSFCALI